MRKNKSKAFILFLFAVFAIALGQGIGLGGGFANFFYSEAYQINGFVRGAIEIPREIPGILSIFLLLFLLKKGDIFSSIVSQVISVIVAFTLAFWTPPFWIMLGFLAFNSLGMHSFFPLQDSITLKLSEANNEAKGKNLSMIMAASLFATSISALLVFFGAKYNVFTFSNHFKLTFLVSGIFYFIGIVFLVMLFRMSKNSKTIFQTKNIALWKGKFVPYFILSGLFGAQKQVNATFAIWMIISVFAKRADYMGILIAIGTFISIFWVLGIGKLTDKTSPKVALIMNGIIAISVAFLYAFLAKGINPIWVAVVFVVDVLGVQLAFARSLYLKKICSSTELTPVLASGVTCDHTVALIVAFVGGWVWQSFGIAPVFIGFGVLQVVALGVSVFGIREK